MISIPGSDSIRTPLLVPSYSSKGFPDVGHIVDVTEPYITSEVLVSAYDIHRGYIKNALDFPSLIFLDSGGYEASVDKDLSDAFQALGNEYQPGAWSEDDFENVLANWNRTPPTVFISYDHPKTRRSFKDQVEAGVAFGGAQRVFARELLLKPTTLEQDYLDLDDVIANVKAFAPFAVIGVTEKELGRSLLDRMSHIGRLRQALTDKNLDTPIHVFGSLDTMSTVLYFVMGADIFDGLTWLRYAYQGGSTVYRQELAATRYPANTHARNVTERCWTDNYLYLQEMVLRMRRFLQTGDFSSFEYNSSKIAELYDKALEHLGGR